MTGRSIAALTLLGIAFFTSVAHAEMVQERLVATKNVGSKRCLVGQTGVWCYFKWYGGSKQGTLGSIKVNVAHPQQPLRADFQINENQVFAGYMSMKSPPGNLNKYKDWKIVLSIPKVSPSKSWADIRIHVLKPGELFGGGAGMGASAFGSPTPWLMGQERLVAGQSKRSSLGSGSGFYYDLKATPGSGGILGRIKVGIYHPQQPFRVYFSIEENQIFEGYQAMARPTGYMNPYAHYVGMVTIVKVSPDKKWADLRLQVYK